MLTMLLNTAANSQNTDAKDVWHRLSQVEVPVRMGFFISGHRLHSAEMAHSVRIGG